MTNKGEAPPRMESIATREEEYLDALDWMLHCDKKGRELYEEFYGRASEYALASAMNHVERDIAQIEGKTAESKSEKLYPALRESARKINEFLEAHGKHSVLPENGKDLERLAGEAALALFEKRKR